MTRPLLRLLGIAARPGVDPANAAVRARDLTSSESGTILGGRNGSCACAFTLLEVMIAAGIFFMATFAILALVAGTIRNARGLQRGDVDAGMAAAQIYQLLKTNRQSEISGTGDFGDAYPDFSYTFNSTEAQTNGLLQVDIVVNRRGLFKPADHLTIWVYSPDAKPRP
jgi:hypothetical protein